MPTVGSSAIGEGPEFLDGSKTLVTRFQMPEAGTITEIENFIESYSAVGTPITYYPVIYREDFTEAYSAGATSGLAKSVNKHILSSGISHAAGEILWAGFGAEAGVGASYAASEGGFDAPQVGSMPPPSTLTPDYIESGFRWSCALIYEAGAAGGVYYGKSIASLSVAGSSKIAASVKQNSLAQLVQSGSAKTKFSFIQKSPGGIFLTGSAKTINLYRAKNLGQAIVGGAAKLRLVSRNTGAGFVSFSGAAKLRLISNYIGVGSSVVSGAAKTSLQINTVTLSVVGRGAINLSGAATVKNSLLQKSAGQFQSSGFGAFRFALNHRSQGNVVVNGQLITRLIYSGKSSGSYVLSGAAKIRQISSYVGLAGGVLGGLGKASLVVGSSSVSFVSTGTMVLSGRTLITLLPQVNWYQNPFLTVYYRPRSRVVKAVPLDRSVIAEAKNRTVKFRF